MVESAADQVVKGELSISSFQGMALGTLLHWCECFAQGNMDGPELVKNYQRLNLQVEKAVSAVEQRYVAVAGGGRHDS